MKFNLILFSTIILFSCNKQRTFDGSSIGSVNVSVGEKFRINLPEDHTTGYTWQLNDTYDKAITDHYNSVWEGNKNGVMFYFVAAKKGKTILNFTSRKYDDVNSIKELTITVN